VRVAALGRRLACRNLGTVEYHVAEGSKPDEGSVLDDGFGERTHARASSGASACSTRTSPEMSFGSNESRSVARVALCCNRSTRRASRKNRSYSSAKETGGTTTKSPARAPWTSKFGN